MEYVIQKLVFPTEEKHRECRKLFYRGSRGVFDAAERSLSIGFGQSCDFVTYLNACSYQKWKKYTGAKGLKLHLTIEGEAEVTFLGYSKDALTVTRVEYDTKKYTAKKKTEIVYEFPEMEEQMVGFEISGLSHCKILGGYYTVNVKKVNDVRLSIATTTCKKEEFIKKNVQIIKEEILDGKDEMAKNVYLHVVDNGRTLDKKDVSAGGQIFLHPNRNAGGSGGYARGMMESLHQKPKATHVLLIDDDVLVLPESIRRTYNLLKLLLPEHRDSIISGAMLYYEQPEYQHEDIGTIQDDCKYGPLKRTLDHTKLKNNLENEKDWTIYKNSFAAWWYCCLPVSAIEEYGLPLPFFIRVDDMEYSLRTRLPLITMNSICVWHMGFTTKYNATFDEYQQYRNWLVSQSIGVVPEVNVIGAIYNAFRVEIIRFNYNAAQLVVEALEDYMKGPKFLETVDGEKITNEHFKLNDKLVPLSELPDGNTFRPRDSYEAPPLTFTNRVLLKLTWNGQQFCPKFLEKGGVVPMGFDWDLQVQRIAMHSKLIAVNPYNETGIYRIKDKARFRELKRRYKRAMKDYKQRGAAVREAYRKEGAYMKSEKFWRKYLELDDGKK